MSADLFKSMREVSSNNTLVNLTSQTIERVIVNETFTFEVIDKVSPNIWDEFLKWINRNGIANSVNIPMTDSTKILINLTEKLLVGIYSLMTSLLGLVNDCLSNFDTTLYYLVFILVLVVVIVLTVIIIYNLFYMLLVCVEETLGFITSIKNSFKRLSLKTYIPQTWFASNFAKYGYEKIKPPGYSNNSAISPDAFRKELKRLLKDPYFYHRYYDWKTITEHPGVTVKFIIKYFGKIPWHKGALTSKVLSGINRKDFMAIRSKLGNSNFEEVFDIDLFIKLAPLPLILEFPEFLSQHKINSVLNFLTKKFDPFGFRTEMNEKNEDDILLIRDKLKDISIERGDKYKYNGIDDYKPFVRDYVNHIKSLNSSKVQEIIGLYTAGKDYLKPLSSDGNSVNVSVNVPPVQMPQVQYVEPVNQRKPESFIEKFAYGGLLYDDYNTQHSNPFAPSSSDNVYDPWVKNQSSANNIW